MPARKKIHKEDILEAAVRVVREQGASALSVRNIAKELHVSTQPLYSEFENFKYYCKKNKINIKKINYSENVVCNIELEESEKEKLLKDYREKKINIAKINSLSIKYINKV